MKEQVLEMYREGFSLDEIRIQTGLAGSSVGAYVYSSGLNKDPEVRATQLRSKIKKLITEYETEFGEKFTH